MDNLSLRRLTVATLMLGILGLVVHGRTVENGYALDARHTVEFNPHVQPETSLGEIFSSPYWDPEAHPGRGLYRPLSVLSFQLTRMLWNEPVVGVDHLLDLGLHVLCSLAVLVFLMQMGAQFGVALTLAALFLLHPIQVEAVASLVGRSDMLATLFALLALILSLSTGVSKLWIWPGVFVFYLMSLLSKESAAGLILLLPLCFVARQFWSGVDRSKIFRAVPGLLISLALAAGLCLVLRQHALGGLLVEEMPIFNEKIAGFFELRWRALAFMTVYGQKLIWPHPLQPDYITGVVPEWGLGLHVRAAIASVAIVASVAWPLWWWVRHRTLTRVHLGILSFWIAVAPVCNLFVQIGSPFAERFLYFPLVFLLLAAVDLPLWRPLSSGSAARVPKLWPAWVLVAIALGVMSARRIPDWSDNRSLFLAASTECPENYISQFTYGSVLVDEGGPEDWESARLAFVEAARILPDAYTPRVALGVVANMQGNALEARTRFEEAYARVDQVTDAEHQVAALNLARSYRALQKFREFESLTVPLAQEHPGWSELQSELANYWLSQGDVAEALVLFERALERNPEDPHLWQNVIWAHLKLGQDPLASERLAAAPPGTRTDVFKAQLAREGLELPDPHANR